MTMPSDTPTLSQTMWARPIARPMSTRRWMIWTGYALSGIPVLMMAWSAFTQITHEHVTVDGMVNKFGIPEYALIWIGLAEAVALVLYVIPRTAVLGLVLITAYFGGAILAHVRIADPFVLLPITMSLLAWGGLYLREPRLRQLIPLRREAREAR